MKRRSLGITRYGALVAATLLGLVGPASAAQFVFLVDGARISAPGVARTDGEVMVPAASAARILGGVLSSDATLGQTILQANNTEISFFSGKNRVLINGEELRIRHTPSGSGGSMIIPIGFAAETLGSKLVREGATRIRVENGAFPPRTSAAEVQLRITASGVFHTPAVWRAFPTFDRLDVSAQDLAKMLGAELKWDPELGAAILSVDTHTLLFFCGKGHAIADGRPVSLNRVPVMSRSQLLIPLADACRMLGRSLTQKSMWTFAIGIPE
ncbi:MAG TPA: stalk domain-containing protein [Armatimonadota bacterium]|nr:stalk domain-containing protein [Armatimonadota bacterium]